MTLNSTIKMKDLHFLTNTEIMISEKIKEKVTKLTFPITCDATTTEWQNMH